MLNRFCSIFVNHVMLGRNEFETQQEIFIETRRVEFTDLCSFFNRISILGDTRQHVLGLLRLFNQSENLGVL